jgi:glutathione S-transferase
MNYLSVAEARKQPGVRLVLTANMPGPWGEAAKAVLSARRVSYLAVAQVVMESNDELHAWTGVRNAPVAVLDEEPPLTTWLDILLLAERVGSGPNLLPSDPLERALVLGLSTEICGSDGFGWSRRLELMGRPSTQHPPGGGSFDMARMIRSYGVRPEAIARAPARMVSIMNGLTAQLRRQHAAGSDYLVGDRLSACDLYWATFSLFVSPLPEADCPMPSFMRANYAHLTPELGAALDPSLIRHRDLIFRKHIALPLDF